MSRVADALARAGAKRLLGSAPVEGSEELFPTELASAAAPDVEFRPEHDIRSDRVDPVPPSIGRGQAAPRSGVQASRWTSEPAIRYRSAFRDDLVEKLTIENGAPG